MASAADANRPDTNTAILPTNPPTPGTISTDRHARRGGVLDILHRLQRSRAVNAVTPVAWTGSTWMAMASAALLLAAAPFAYGRATYPAGMFGRVAIRRLHKGNRNDNGLDSVPTR